MEAIDEIYRRYTFYGDKKVQKSKNYKTHFKQNDCSINWCLVWPDGSPLALGKSLTDICSDEGDDDDEEDDNKSPIYINMAVANK